MARNFFRIFTENNPVMWDSKTFCILEAKGLNSLDNGSAKLLLAKLLLAKLSSIGDTLSGPADLYSFVVLIKQMSDIFNIITCQYIARYTIMIT